jgi:hypothetical protein
VGLDLKDGYAAVSNDYWGFHVYDVTAPALPEKAAEQKVGKGYNPVMRLDDLLYTGTTELQIYSMADPENPVLVGTGPTFTSTIFEFEISGDLLIVNGFNEVGILDITTPAAPIELTRFFLEHPNAHMAGMALDGHILGLFCNVNLSPYFYNTFDLYDLSTPGSPALLSSTEYDPLLMDEWAPPGSTNVEADQGRFFVCTWDDITVIDAQDPLNPLIAAVYPETPCNCGSGSGFDGIRMKDGLLYVAGHHGLEIMRFLDVGLFLEPEAEPVVVTEGDSFFYDMTVENFTGTAQTLLVRVDEVFGGSGSGPAAGPVWITLGPGESVTYTRVQAVPLGTPAGTYRLNAHVKALPDVEMDSDRITFQVTP